MNKNTKRSSAAPKKRSSTVAVKTPPPLSATQKGSAPITLSSPLLSSEHLCWLLAITYFTLGIAGVWTSSATIVNMAYPKDIWGQVALSVIWVLWCWQQRNSMEPLRLSWPRLLFLGFMIWISITIFWSINLDFYVFKWMKWVAGAIGFYLCLQLKTKHFSLLLDSIVLSASVVALIAMAQVFLDLKILPQAAVPAGTFGNKNMLGHFMVLAFPGTVYLLLKSNNNRIQTAYYSISAVLILATVFHITARGSWLAISLGIVIMMAVLLIDKRNRDQWIKRYKATRQQSNLIALIALCLLVTLISFDDGEFKFFPVRIATEIGDLVDTYQSYSGTETNIRYRIWQAGLDMIKDASLFGHGLGGFFGNVLIGNTNYNILRISRVHNDYLEIWIETGFVGLVLYLSCLLSIVYCVIYALKRADYENRLMITCLFAGISSSLVNGLFSFPLQLITPIMILSIYAAILIRLTEDQGLGIFLFRNTYLLHRILIIISLIVASFVLVANKQWWDNYNYLNEIYNKKQSIYDPDIPIFDIEQVLNLWTAGKLLNNQKRYKHSIEIMTSLHKRWPDDYNSLEILFNAYKGLNNYKEAIRIGQIGLGHSKNGNFNFYIKLFKLYMSTKNKEKAFEIYQGMLQVPEEARRKNPEKYYESLISFNLNLGLNTPQQHYQELERLGLVISDAEKNMAFFYMFDNNLEMATRHIKNFLKLSPQDPSADRMRMYLKQQHQTEIRQIESHDQ